VKSVDVALRLVPPLSARARRLSGRQTELVAVSWCINGQKVYARKPMGRWVLCAVVCTAGYRARVKNELHGIDAWMHMDSLRVPRTSHFAMTR
jgi:hypothetical protein